MLIDKSKLMALSLPALTAMREAISEVVDFKLRQEIRFGSMIEFKARNGRIVRAKVKSFGPKNVAATETLADGRTMNWRVHPTFVKVIPDADKPVKRKFGEGADRPAMAGSF